MTADPPCTEETGRLCQYVLETTGNADLARFADIVLARPAAVALIIIGAVLLHRLGARLIRRVTRRYESEIHARIDRAAAMGTAGGSPRAATRRLQRLHAISGAARSGLSLILGTAALLLSLAQFVDLGPILAGAGLAGLVIGFGAQNLIADLLAGFSMLVEDQYGVGDWIDVDGKIGEVEHVGLRTTSFRDLDGTVWHVPNGQVSKVGNLSQRWARATLEVPLPLDIDIIHARKVVSEVAHGLANDPRWSDDIIAEPEIWGVTEWNAEGLRLRVVVATRPLRNWDVNRQLRERLHIAFAREDIRMPVAMREVSGSPQRSPVRLHGVDTDDIESRELPPYDPTQTDRLGGEWDWPYPDVEPGDTQRRPIRPE